MGRSRRLKKPQVPVKNGDDSDARTPEYRAQSGEARMESETGKQLEEEQWRRENKKKKLPSVKSRSSEGDGDENGRSTGGAGAVSESKGVHDLNPPDGDMVVELTDDDGMPTLESNEDEGAPFLRLKRGRVANVTVGEAVVGDENDFGGPKRVHSASSGKK